MPEHILSEAEGYVLCAVCHRVIWRTDAVENDEGELVCPEHAEAKTEENDVDREIEA